MDLDLDTMWALAQTCGPTVAPATLVSVAHAESRFDPLAIGINGPTPRSLSPPNVAAATRTATALIAEGLSIDLGLGQINSKNLSWLGLSIADAFDPCKNLAASARILAAGYRPASAAPEAEQAALRTALSRYNTGDPERGFRNGYVARVEHSARQLVPQIRTVTTDANALASSADIGPITLEAALEPPSWDVFARATRSPLFVFATANSQAVP